MEKLIEVKTGKFSVASKGINRFDPPFGGLSPLPKNPRNFPGILILMHMHFVYFIYSPKFQKTYVGRTSNYEGRLEAHNHPSNKGFTKRFRPWVLSYEEKFASVQM